MKIKTKKLLKGIGEMTYRERQKFAKKLFKKYCNHCLSERPCYCMRDD